MDGAIEVVHAVEVIEVVEGRETAPVVEGRETTPSSFQKDQNQRWPWRSNGLTEVPARRYWLGDGASNKTGGQKESRGELGEHGSKSCLARMML